MTNAALPHMVEFRTLAARGIHLKGTLSAARLPRLRDAVLSIVGSVQTEIQFDRDEEGRPIAAIVVVAQVKVACQRCLQELEVVLETSSRLAAVWNDEQAAALPGSLEPLVMAEEVDLWGVVDEELLLALPQFSYHAERDCGVTSGRVVAPALPVEDAERENPFSVLASLKNSDT
jgi:uncharacterized protein